METDAKDPCACDRCTSEETCPCNRCGKALNKAHIDHYRSLAPMTGYNCIPDESYCVVCGRNVCKACMYGLGMFTFVCKEQCKPAWDVYMGKDNSDPGDKRFPAKLVVARQRIDAGETPKQVAGDLRTTPGKLLLAMERTNLAPTRELTTEELANYPGV